MTSLQNALGNIKTPKQPTTLYAIETAVTDIHWEGGDDALKKEFFSRLPELLRYVSYPEQQIEDAPRGGDIRMIDADIFEQVLNAFPRVGEIKSRYISSSSGNTLVEHLQTDMFGTPTYHAGEYISCIGDIHN
jgi:hypothetical protein